MAGNLSVGDKVRIGFGDAKGILKKSQHMVKNTARKPSEAIFVYSCTARKYFMGQQIEEEIKPLQSIAPVTGFFTYGEFFTSTNKELLNQTMTILSLSESDELHELKESELQQKIEIKSDYFGALNHLVDVASEEVQEYTRALKVSYEQNKKLSERMELALWGSNDCVWDWDVVKDKLYFSARWEEISGYGDDRFEEALRIWESYIHPDDIEQFKKDIEQNFDKKTEYFENSHRIKHHDGRWIWIRARAKTHFDSEGQPVRMTGTITDITKEKIEKLKHRLKSKVIDQIYESVIVTDTTGNILTWNNGSEKLFGYREKEVLGEYLSMLFQDSGEALLEEIKEILLKRDIYNAEINMITKSKESIPIDVSITLLKDEKDQAIGFVIINQDITEYKKEQKKLNEQKNVLSYKAHYDALTDLPNRTLFSDRLQQGIVKAQRHQSLLALFFIDLDRFKEINDTFGHLVGDKVLKSVAKRLSETIRKSDTLSRLSGDEFTIIMEELHESVDTVKLAEKILESLSAPMEIEGEILNLSGSIGISLYPDDATTAHDLLQCADTAMYEAKEKGRNKYRFYSSKMSELAHERTVIKNSLKEAIKEDQFIACYQPQFDVVDGSLIGMEALVRWEHPTKGLLLPEEFVSIAEESGIIIEMDRMMIKKVINQIKRWRKNGLQPGIVSINLTKKQLEQPDFLKEIEDCCFMEDFTPDWLEFELAEGQLVKSPEEMIEKIKKINALGIKVSIDDFGTGYSSLSLLKRLPIHRLKIDKSLVQGIVSDTDSTMIVKTIITLAKNFNLGLIAEGVETVEQKEFLIEHGCTKFQGYYFSKPLTATEITSMLLEKKDTY
jgi:diguanylate cyclase (GGDEF)-like protein/PAS domain S-box-containing protein